MLGDILYFDIETKHLAHEVGGWDNIVGMGVSVATSYDSATSPFYSFEESEIAGLIDQILNAGLVVGYNHLRFDYRVLSAYSDADFWSVPSFDMLVAVKATLGHRVKLDHIVRELYTIVPLYNIKQIPHQMALLIINAGSTNVYQVSHLIAFQSLYLSSLQSNHSWVSSPCVSSPAI